MAKKKTKEKTIFKVKFECENCTHRFITPFKKGEFVTKDHVWGTIDVNIKDDEEGDKSYLIICDKCGYNKLKILERKLV